MVEKKPAPPTLFEVSEELLEVIELPVDVAADLREKEKQEAEGWERGGGRSSAKKDVRSPAHTPTARCIRRRGSPEPCRTAPSPLAR